MGVRADAVVSLQNTCLRGLGDIPQILYFHQSIPLYPQQWNPLKRSERTMAFYKYFYPFFIRYSLPKHVKVVAQIPFIKRGFCRKFGVPEEQVYVCFPDVEQIDIQSVEPYEGWSKDAVHFVYPAIPAPYKHHDTILRALGVIKKREPDLAQRIKVHFTCTPEAAPNIVSLAKEQDADAMVCFEGHVDHSVLLSMYQASHGLLFPSSIETIGLPLLEAAAFGLNVVVSDLDFAREVIAPYEGAQLIDNNNYEAWAEAIAQCARNNRRFTPYEMSGSGSWPSFFDLIN
jgi:glycosyltransferase involved in cell wall biosynthesis